MADLRTGTYWNHMTGEALYGPLVGNTLQVESVIHTTVKQVLAEDPNALVAISDHPQAAARVRRAGSLAQLLERIPGVPQMFPATMGNEDDRRERMDIGIGLWGDGGARYYPMETVIAEGGALLDRFDGRTVLVYNDPTARALLALRTDAGGVRWEGDVLHLSTGERIEEGVLLHASGERAQVDRPLQVFTRWYGFSLTFPDTEIYSGH